MPSHIYNVAADPLRIKQYNLYHQHIVPELINTLGIPQSEAIDIFSIGRILNICPLVHNNGDILPLAKQLKVVPPPLKLSLKDTYLML